MFPTDGRERPGYREPKTDMRIAIDCTHHQWPGGIRVYLENLVASLV